MLFLEKKRRAITRLTVKIVFWSVFFLTWEGSVHRGWINEFFLPRPSTLLNTFGQILADPDIFDHLSATFSAAVIGIVLGIFIGMILGFMAFLIPFASDILEPFMVLLNAIPRVVLAPLMVIWFGIDIGSKIALSLVLVTVLMFFAVYSGIKNSDKNLEIRVRTLGGGLKEVIRYVYLPSLFLWVMSNFRVSVGLAFTGAVVGEFVASSRGLGYMLQFAQSTYNASLTIALVILIALFVMILFFFATLLEKKVLSWQVQGNE